MLISERDKTGWVVSFQLQADRNAVVWPKRKFFIRVAAQEIECFFQLNRVVGLTQRPVESLTVGRPLQVVARVSSHVCDRKGFSIRMKIKLRPGFWHRGDVNLV